MGSKKVKTASGVSLLTLDLEKETERLNSGEISFAAAAASLSLLNDVAAARKTKDQDAIDKAFSQAEVLTDALAFSPAKSLDDIAFKVEAWFVMASEDVFNINFATCDEMLALSIMKDVRRLAGHSSSSQIGQKIRQ